MFDEFPALKAHFELLQRWNKTLNLTRIESPERNYGESLFLARHLPPGPLSICDVGSGAGFPGFPVAVARPDCQVTLIESHQRKAVFLKEASRGIGNIRVLGKRGQDVHERFDWAVSRAVSAEDLSPFLGRLARSVALLTGSDVPEIRGVEWRAAILLPGSDGRYLRMGVSRETV